MEKAPPATFPHTESKIDHLSHPMDAYIIEFYQKHPDSLYHDPKNLFTYDRVPSDIFAARVIELKEQNVDEDEAKAVAHMELNENKERKKAYEQLKEIYRLQGKKPPPNTYPTRVLSRKYRLKEEVYPRQFLRS